MDEQALRGLASMASSQEQSRALEYFEHLKSSENGWKLCAQALTTSQGYWDDYVKFFCLQVIEAYLKDRYRKCSNGDCELVRSLVASLLEIQGTKPDKNFVKNKVSQIVSLVFVADYPHRWASFFTDLLGTLVLGPAATDMFLRVLLQIDSEVVDRDIVHTQEETERNTAIKDAMREQAVQQLTDAWYQILVVGKYISWIDIGLIANEQFVPVIIRFLSNALLRESACDCISEIVSKGMEPRAKTKLVESFTHVLEESGHFNLPQDVDVDFLAKMSRMINCMGVQLISCWQKMCKVDAEMAAVSLQAAENKVPLLLRFLGDEDDDVSAAVATFTTDYISLLKQLQTLSQKQKDNVEGEEEAMFQEYRKQLKTIFTNLASLDIGMVEGSVQRLVGDTLTNWKARPLADIEVAIHLLYIMGEALPLVSSGVSCHGHMMVMVHFFETVVRYEKFFQCEPQHIPHVLGAFLDERGFHHLQGYIEEILGQFGDLLTVNSPENGCQHLLSSDDQLFVYETAGSLIVSSNFPPQRKGELMRQVVGPIAAKFSTLMEGMGAIAPFLQEVFMPVVRTIFAVLCQPADERDQVASMERLLLQRGYYQFLATIVTNDVLDVLKHQDASNLEHVLMTIVRGATDMPDPSSQKTCFNILKRLVEAWGGEEGLPGFVDFVYKNIVPACFLAPLKPDFDMRDGQSALGGEFVEYLRGEYLATLNLSLDLRQQFCDALSLDNKQFKSYFKTFMMKAKS
ncbi:XPOT-like protein [Mya arenaria]|uniref:Exportin-T n=1 Tax=Mya arenaria TaxID=6604 RepID=A0ABY7FYF2_MYAAR|nr:XPOT-like protein [Mya arenaria]